MISRSTRRSSWFYAALPAALTAVLYSCSSGGGGGGGGPPAVVNEVEPNDTFAQARTITLGRAGSGELATETDVDFWKIALTAGTVVQIELFGTRFDHNSWEAGDSIPRITVYDTNGTTVLANHDYTNQWSWGKHDLDHPLLRVAATGTYFASITNDGLAVTDGDYAIRVNRVNIGTLQLETGDDPPGDNDTFGTAEPIVPGTVYGFHDDDDSDYYSFVITSPSIVRFEMTSYRNGIIDADDEYFDTQLNLYDTDGVTVLFGNDDSYFYDSAIQYHIATPGTYFVDATECCGLGDAPYFLSFSRSAAGGATESEPNDDTATADSIAYGGSIQGSMDAALVDFFTFTGTRGDMVRVQLFDSSNSEAKADGVVATLYGTDGTTALTTGGNIDFQTYTTILQETGNHYIKVEPSAGLTDYRVELTRFRSATYESEPNNVFGDANGLGGEGRSAGVIGAAADADVFRFTVAANRLTTISIYASSSATDSDGFDEFSGHGSALQPTLRILDAAGLEVETSPGDWAFVSTESVTNGLPCGAVSFAPSVGGAYYVEVTDAPGLGGAAYYYVIERTN